ncbi:hypothetical protein IPJ72_04045 [Candidatus Peregrinibacteria bacterium]|nr:MAG: hypothetical protein IPJ72_04045 [Candidatus Peregrinibacteria bacterium]
MKFYKAKHSVVGEGVEATVVYHKDNGDELVCIREGFEIFEEANPDAKEQTVEETDKLLEKEVVIISVPSKAEIRTQKQLTKEEIQAEIESEETPTADIAVIEEKDEQGKSVQKLTYFEKREIKTVEDFLKAQEEQQKELEHVAPADEIAEETKTDTEVNL